ncbi:MAG: flippase-like domain-containing protein [Chloroflexi bacterium]|nr:flippase-like domain-containing protein [Chloroflexota bacterium]
MTPRKDGLLARLKGQLQFVVGGLVSGLAIWWFVQGLDWVDVLDKLGKANLPVLLLCLATVLVSMVLKVVRWRLLFPDSGGLTLRPLLAALYIGYLANTILPGRVGELVRAFVVGQRTSASTSTAIATIVIEKLLDIGTLVVMLVGLLLIERPPAPPDQPDLWQHALWGAGLAAMAGAVALGVMLLVPGRVQGLVEALEARVAPLKRLGLSGLSRSFLDGLATISHPSILPRLAFWSVALWAMATATIYLGIIGAGVPVSVPGAILVLVATNLGMAIPSAPGYVGVYHAVFVQALGPYHIADEQALKTAALLVHLIVFGTFIVGGIWYLWRDGLSLRGLRHASHGQVRGATHEEPATDGHGEHGESLESRRGESQAFSVGGNVVEP